MARAQVRLLPLGTDVCDEPDYPFDIVHWYRYWGLLTASHGAATFEVNRCDDVAVAITKPGFKTLVAPVDSCMIARLRTKTFTFELMPKPGRPSPARGPGLAAMTFVEALIHGGGSTARALTAPGSDLVTAPDSPIPIKTHGGFGKRQYAAYAPSAEHVWTSEQGDRASTCVRLVSSDGCDNAVRVDLIASVGEWKVDSLVGGRCDTKPPP